MEVMAYYDATELRSTENWISPGSNLSAFTMQPSGFYDSSSPFPYQGLFTVGIFWIYSPGSTVYYACEFGYACGSTEIIPGSATKSFSVRCLKDRE